MATGTNNAGKGGAGEEGRSGIADELLARIEGLTAGQQVDLSEHIAEFPEIARGFSIPNAELTLIPDRSVASLEDGGSFELVGFLTTPLDAGTEPAIQFKRHLKLGEQCADHQWLKVAAPLRGMGLSSALLLRSFNLYRELGLRAVELDAAMEAGKWHWARVGFEFMWPRQAEAVRKWTFEVAEALKPEGLSLESLSTATQFARMEARRGTSLAELATAFPAMTERLSKIAKENDLEFDEKIAFGRAVMLSGPGWEGKLDLDGPSYQQFKSYAEAKAEEAERALSQISG